MVEKTIEKKEMLYEGKAKRVFATNKADMVIQEFKDDATAFDATKRGTIKEKGVVNNRVSARIFDLLDKKGIETHFVKLLDDRNMLVKKLDIIPVEVTMRNIVAGGMAKLLGLEEGIVLKEPVLEYHYKKDELHDPLINDYHIKALGIATDIQLRFIRKRAFEINNILKRFFAGIDLDLVDFKLEFGVHKKGEILLGDEISPDTCRLWDKETKKKLDKDRFRRDLGDVEDAYQEILKRVQG
jgi:phosphoribosylaminoimidazole-succinocarboxamide synthase